MTQLDDKEDEAMKEIVKRAGHLMGLHCIVCCKQGVFTVPSPEAVAFLDYHEKTCGPKSVGGTLVVEKKP